MAEPTNITEAIEQAALEPKRVSVAGQSVELPSLDELIRASHHVAGEHAAQGSSLGIYVRRLTRTYE